MKNAIRTVLLVLCAIVVYPRAEAATRRALLIGIANYGSSSQRGPNRGLVDLAGPVNDVEAMRQTIVSLYGFSGANIVTLVDQAATRDAIRGALEQLGRRSRKGDVVLFYFAGHGSQAPNPLSDEPDKLDETIVPADARLGVRDIHDKELRRSFNRILDAGARLTVIFDSCHSGSAARGVPAGGVWRGIDPDPRDVGDVSPDGPIPEDRGALVLSATTDRGLAFETVDELGHGHGAFSMALLQAIREAPPNEAAIDLFVSVRSRLSSGRRFQYPVIAGSAAALQSPFLARRAERRAPRTIVAVESIREDGVVEFRGGWLNGISAGAELRPVAKNDSGLRFRVTALSGVAECEARRIGGAPKRTALKPGMLFELDSWVAPPAETLRVWMPRVSSDAAELSSEARALESEAVRRGMKWLADPAGVPRPHLLRWKGGATALHEVEHLPANSVLFVQFPVPAVLVSELVAAIGSERPVVEEVANAEDADYLLIGRWSANALEYAWVRPFMTVADGGLSALPRCTAWHRADSQETPGDLAEAALRLRKIRAWQLAQSPPGAAFSYRLALRRSRDRVLVNDGTLRGDESYGVVLRAREPRATVRQPRSVYALVIDSNGRSTLLYPRNGSVENVFPAGDGPAPAEIDVGIPELFNVAPPFGIDTYYLLTTDEPLDDPWVLEWDGVGTRGSGEESPLADLLADLNGRRRGTRPLSLPANWSIESIAFHSIPGEGTGK